VSRGLRYTLVALACVVLAYGAYRVVRHAREPVIPAVVTRKMDVHRAVSLDLDARIDRYLHDQPPADRSDSPKLIALTFDDGPYPVETPLLLDTLADAGVKATFFLIGRDAQEFPELTRRIAREGHEIGNHTLTHPNLDQLDAAGVRAELDGGRAALEGLVTQPSIATLMRPPHGRFTEQTLRVAQGAGYDVILWSDDPGDWRSVEPAALASHLAEHATAPDIVLLHSGRLGTIEMLHGLIERFRSAGFEFVTVGELLRRVPVNAIDHPLRRPV
jgi:peptidoglycan/xylan/chitin deacetylase (PgdA/CDA1 family)